MARRVKHLSLHRIGATELRVVADVEAGVLPIIQQEEVVIRGFSQRADWPHRCVTLFIMADLQPLAQQFAQPRAEIGTQRPEASLPQGSDRRPGPEGLANLQQRPVVNVYDLAKPDNCHVFVNQQAMQQQGYWDDPLSVEGLLAHEHAHPLAENETSASSRQLKLELTMDHQSRFYRVLSELLDELCLVAPREIFANEMTIRGGFAPALFHLDQCNIANAARSVLGRAALATTLQTEVQSARLDAATAEVLLLIGDLRAYLNLAMEIVAFARTERMAEARELEMGLRRDVFPVLETEAMQAYDGVFAQYQQLRPDLSQSALMDWADGVLGVVGEALAHKGLALQHKWMFHAEG